MEKQDVKSAKLISRNYVKELRAHTDHNTPKWVALARWVQGDFHKRAAAKGNFLTAMPWGSLHFTFNRVGSCTGYEESYSLTESGGKPKNTSE